PPRAASSRAYRAAGRTRTSARPVRLRRSCLATHSPRLADSSWWRTPSSAGRAERAARRRARADEGVRPHELQSPIPNHLAIHLRAPLARPLLRREIDVHDAESLGVAEGPFEIVEEGPDEVAADVDACAHRFAE